MSVEFNEEKNFNQSYASSSASRGSAAGLTAWIIKKGWAKDTSGANALMIIVMVICFALAIFFAVR